MRIRNIKRKIKLRFLTYVLAIVFFIFVLIVFYTLVIKLFRFGFLAVSDDASISQPSSISSGLDVGTTVDMNGSIYRKTINQEPYYVLFGDNNDARYILDRSAQQWLDVNLGKNVIISGEILRFVGTIPYVLVNN